MQSLLRFCFSLVVFLQLGVFQLLACDLTIMQIGDSVANNPRNRVAADVVFTSVGINTTWIGDHGSPPTFAQGGISYAGMLNGNSALGHTGLIDIVDGIETGAIERPRLIMRSACSSLRTPPA